MYAAPNPKAKLIGLKSQITTSGHRDKADFSFPRAWSGGAVSSCGKGFPKANTAVATAPTITITMMERLSCLKYWINAASNFNANSQPK
eukprot:Skav219445  [mRNA]  locus=scaffold1461:222120:223764:- [translate_table: standard]